MYPINIKKKFSTTTIVMIVFDRNHTHTDRFIHAIIGQQQQLNDDDIKIVF